MGAWGYAAFQNDDAVGWFFQVEDDGLGALEKALRRGAALEVAADKPELPRHINETVAAASVVAGALSDGFRLRLPDDVQAWLNAHVGAIVAPHRKLALAGVERARQWLVIAQGHENAFRHLAQLHAVLDVPSAPVPDVTEVAEPTDQRALGAARIRASLAHMDRDALSPAAQMVYDMFQRTAERAERETRE
jgi:hypothetical protein